MTDKTPRLVEFCPGLEKWAEPDLSILGDDLPAAPSFPIGVLPPKWGRIVEQAARATSSPADFAGATLLGVIGGLLSGVRSVSPHKGWEGEPPLLWINIIAEPSTGKSPAMDIMLSPLRSIDADLAVGFEETKRGHIEATERSKKVLEDWRDDLRGTDDEQPAPPMPAEAVAPIEPSRPRRLTSDTTIEKAAAICASGGRGLIVHNDEQAAWLKNFNRRGGDDKHFWLQGYGGRGYVIDRVGRSDPVVVDQLCLTVIGAITTDCVRSLFVNTEDDGLSARFVHVYPSLFPPFELPTEDIDRDFLEKALRRLEALSPQIDENGKPSTPVVRFSQEATNAFAGWRRNALPRHIGSCRGMLKSWTGKTPGNIVRLAMVLEYLCWLESEDRPEPQSISQSACEASIAFFEDYALPMARRALTGGSQRPEAADAALVARWLLDHLGVLQNLPVRRRSQGTTQVCLRDLRRYQGFPVTDAKALDAAAKVLSEANFWVPVGRSTNGRPGKDYEISPRLTLAKTAESAKSLSADRRPAPFDSFGSFDMGAPDPERAAIMAVDSVST